MLDAASQPDAPQDLDALLRAETNRPDINGRDLASCDCPFPTLRVVRPDYLTPASVTICGEVGDEVVVNVELALTTCAICGAPTCTLRGISVQEALQHPTLSLIVPPGASGTDRIGGELGDDARIRVDVRYAPIDRSPINPATGLVVKEIAYLQVDLDCPATTSGTDIGLLLEARASGGCDH